MGDLLMDTQIEAGKITEDLKSKRDEIVARYRLNDGTALLTYEQAKRYYKKVKPKRFGPEEIVLLLLGVTPDKPVRGKTMLMKQAFLSERELLKKDLQDLKFVGHKYGPHSFLIDNVLKNLEFLDYIKRQGKSPNFSRYLLTEKGMEKAKQLLDKLSSSEYEKLKKKRISWDELGTDGILRFVYNKYPRYIDNSVIKYRYVIIDWSKKK
jgi:hypothetical protein